MAYAALPEHHPALFVDMLKTLFKADLDRAAEFWFQVASTPESAASWGDLSRPRAALTSGLKIGMTPLYAIGAPDVAYVRLVETSDHFNPSVNDVPATLHATLVWRPEIQVMPNWSWRIHALGDPMEPMLVPRTAIGTDPRRL